MSLETYFHGNRKIDSLDLKETENDATFRTICEYLGREAQSAHERLIMFSDSDRVRDGEAMFSDGKVRDTCREEYSKYLFDGHEKKGIQAFVDKRAGYVKDIKCLMVIVKLASTCSMASDVIATHYLAEKRVLPLVTFWMGNVPKCCQEETKVYGIRIFFPTREAEIQKGDGKTEQMMPFLWAKMKKGEMAEAYTRNEIWNSGCCYDTSELEVKIVSPQGILQMSEGTPMDSVSLTWAASLLLVPVRHRAYGDFDTIKFREKQTDNFARLQTFEHMLRRASTSIIKNSPDNWLSVFKTINDKECDQPSHISDLSIDELRLKPHIDGHASYLMSPNTCKDGEFGKMLAVLDTLDERINAFRQWAAMSVMYTDVNNYRYHLLEHCNLRLSWTDNNISETDSYWKALPSRVKELMKQLIEKRSAMSTLLEREASVTYNEQQQQVEEIRLCTKRAKLLAEEQKFDSLRELFGQGHEAFKNIAKIFKGIDSNKRKRV